MLQCMHYTKEQHSGQRGAIRGLSFNNCLYSDLFGKESCAYGKGHANQPSLIFQLTSRAGFALNPKYGRHFSSTGDWKSALFSCVTILWEAAGNWLL